MFPQQSTIPMFILRATMATIPIMDLQSAAAGAQSAFNTAHLLPHGFESADAAAAVAAAASLHSVQRLLGEDPTKMSRVNTKTVVTSIVRSERQIVTACANASVLTHTLVDHDVTSIDASKVPFSHLLARKIAITLTSRECMEFMTKYRCNAKLHYYAFGLLNRIQCIAYKVLKDEGSIRAAAPRNGNTNATLVNKASFQMATNTLDKGIESLIEVFANAKELEHNSMYTSSVFSEESQAAYAASTLQKRKLPHDAHEPPLKSKRALRREQQEAIATKPKNVGAIICRSKHPLTLPADKDWPQGETALCPAALRNGSKGCLRPGCTRNHTKMTSWSKTLIKFMIAFVDKTADITWNHAVATPDILGLKLNASAAKVPPG